MDKLGHCIRCGRWVHNINDVGICYRCQKEVQQSRIRTPLIMKFVELNRIRNTIKESIKRQMIKDYMWGIICEVLTPEERKLYEAEINELEV
jgi:hypothetical protein